MLHEMRAPQGMVVREFSSPGGKIFAVAWEGSSLPDLHQLLGSYFEEFQQAAALQSRRGGHGPLFIQQNGLTVELGGHMRSYRGRAYLTGEFPTGVRVEDIR